MSDKSPPDSGTRSPSSPGIGSVSRSLGVLIALVTAAIVFAGGNALLPSPRRPPPPLPVAAPPPPAPPVAAPPPPVPGADAATDKNQTDAGPASDAHDASQADRAPSTSTVRADDAGDAKPPASGDAATASDDAGEASGGDGGPQASPDCALAEKDMAREAWRRNWPTICPVADTGKAFILIPIKGSLENAIWELRRKPAREARVILPAAESQLTLKLYKLRRMGFKDLKIGPTDDGSGTRLRVRLLPGAGDPVFDVKESYAKITVAVPGDE